MDQASSVSTKDHVAKYGEVDINKAMRILRFSLPIFEGEMPEKTPIVADELYPCA